MSTDIQIEKNVQIPGPVRGGVCATLRAMEVGDSFALPLLKRASVATTVGLFAPKKYTIRKVSETEVRVWRIA